MLIIFTFFPTGGLVLIVSLVFAEKAKDRSWMPRPWLNYLSFSYGCNVMCGFASAFAGIIMLIKATDIRKKPDKPKENFEFEEKPPTERSEGKDVGYLPQAGGSVYPAPQKVPPGGYYARPPRSQQSRDYAPSVSSQGSVFPPQPRAAQPISSTNGSDKKSESFV